jgi:hypothetical protein
VDKELNHPKVKISAPLDTKTQTQSNNTFLRPHETPRNEFNNNQGTDLNENMSIISPTMMDDIQKYISESNTLHEQWSSSRQQSEGVLSVDKTTSSVVKKVPSFTSFVRLFYSLTTSSNEKKKRKRKRKREREKERERERKERRERENLKCF